MYLPPGRNRENMAFSNSQKPLEALVPFVKQPETEKVMIKMARRNEGDGLCLLIPERISRWPEMKFR
jgi:hypothetical protein